MAFLSSLAISASALTAHNTQIDVIAQNLANANVTRTDNGEPYRRQYVTMAQGATATFGSAYASALGRLGVRVDTIEEDTSEFKLDYQPTHPDADENGYVRMPNVDTVKEMVDMMTAIRSYEANITAIDAFKDMAMRALQIGR